MGTDPSRPTRVEIDQFLRSHHTLRLATISPDGMTPHVVPVWYMYKDGKFYIGTHTRTAKAKNIAKTGRAAFCVDTGVHSPHIFGVSGHGAARLLTKDIPKIARRILDRYYDNVDESKEAQQLLADTDCIIQITPKGITGWRY